MGSGNQRLSVAGLLRTARSQLERLSPAQALDAVAAGALIVDIRPVEHRQRDGEIAGAHVVSRNVLEWRLDPASPHRLPELARTDCRVILLCNEGYQSSLAAATLRAFGLDATDVIGGVQAWIGSGLPTERPQSSLAETHGGGDSPSVSANRAHWESVYAEKEPGEVSWYEAAPRASLAFIDALSLQPGAAVIDVGGGASHLAGELLARGFENVTVADISGSALERAQADLGSGAGEVRWQVADVREHDFGREFALWHDRAVFHFMVDPADRAAYIDTARSSIAVGGHAIVATFAPDGPTTCSGLPVRRYSAAELAAAFGDDFTLESSLEIRHETPSGDSQQFVYAQLTR